jgi:5-(carboxyamino)imidazole ribonucleotide synthase
MTQRIWVIGAGQLGYMMRHAGMPLQLDVIPVDLNSTTPVSLSSDDLVTAEIEYWPANAATTALAQHPRFINAPVFDRLADRLTQKQLLDQLGIPTAPWSVVDKNITAESLYEKLGERVLLKSRRGGYDGRGQLWLKKNEQAVPPEEWRDTSIAEQAIAFEDEVSLIGIRDQQGNCFFYPLTLNLHVNGILMASIAPLPQLAKTKITVLQTQAEKMLRSILNELNYVGVMAMECFRLGDQLLVNELAPRVHNSGHWTQSGASISQFEAHLRAIAQLPMHTPVVRATSAMVNLVGVERNDTWLAVPGAHLFWYGKEVRAGRKVGHLNFCDPDSLRRRQSFSELKTLLPASYQPVLDWIISHDC